MYMLIPGAEELSGSTKLRLIKHLRPAEGFFE